MPFQQDVDGKDDNDMKRAPSRVGSPVTLPRIQLDSPGKLPRVELKRLTCSPSSARALSSLAVVDEAAIYPPSMQVSRSQEKEGNIVAYFKTFGMSIKGGPFKGRAILSSLSADIRAGELIAIMGSSGSGKTTLLKSLARQPQHNLEQSGVMGATPFFQFVRQFDVGKFENMTPFDLLQINAVLAQATPEASVLAQAWVGKFLHSPIAGLSGGQRKILAVATALLSSLKLLLLDEPTRSSLMLSLTISLMRTPLFVCID